MRDLRIDVFDQSRTATLLRFVADGQARERLLPDEQVAEVLDAVGDAYVIGGPALRSVGSPTLRAIGERLYAFLDGEERWLTASLGDRPEAMLRITTANDALRHLPWELMAAGGSYLGAHATYRFTPIRNVSPAAGTGSPPANRPLRVLFMAASPEGVEPELSFEAEEAMILEATTEAGAEVVVEESGSLEGLRYLVESYGAGYFDVLHLSGHAVVAGTQPYFVLEDDIGARSDATPVEMAQAVGGLWPRLVFVSGCETGQSPGSGGLPSMSESLVRAGAPVVLGWALPVGDVAASIFAATLYGELAKGRPVGHAVAKARHDLHAAESIYWHLLRMYADATPLGALVTPANTPGRPSIPVTPAANDFLDPSTGLVKVASRQQFVGRRRLIQRGLRTLKAPMSDPATYQGLVLSGMGGLGKSTLASRLVERMSTHQRVVLLGRIDEGGFRRMVVDRLGFDTLEDQQEAARILNAPEASLADRVRFLLRGPMATTPALFVFDDFEHGNLDERDGGHVCSADAHEVLSALMSAIRVTNSASKVIITSRYQFPAPAGTRLRFEALESLNPNELQKKLIDLEHLRADSTTDPAVRERAIEVAAGNPRLLEWLDRVIGAGGLEVASLLTAIESRAAEFREDVLAQELLDALPAAARRLVAQLNVIDLPVPLATVEAVAGPAVADAHVARLGALGLIETGLDPESHEPRYLVSNVLRPLLADTLDDRERREACAAAARSLFALWWSPS